MPARPLHVVITGDPRPFQAALAKAGASTTQFGAKQKSASARVAATGSTLTKGLTLPILAAGAASVKFASDFESQMSSLASVTDAPKRAMEALKEQALDAGAATKFSAQDAAVAQTELAKGGLSTAQILRGALGGALSLAAAGELELGEAAEVTANALNLFKMNGKDAGAVADALATAANATTADVSDFGMALKQSGSVAKSAGLSFTDTVVALEALAASGIKNSDAGTSLKAALIQLIKPTEKQAALADDLGLKFTDAGGNMKSLADISSMLRGKLGGMTAAQRTAALATLAGTDGVRTLTSLYDAGPKALEKWRKGLLKEGSAHDVAAKKQDNLKGKLEQLKGSLETLAIIVGTVLIPPLTELAQKITSFANDVGKAFSGLDKHTQQLVLMGLGVAAALGPILLIGAKIATAMQVLGAALGVVSLPALAVVAAIAAVAVGLVYAYKTSEQFRNAVDKVGAAITDSIGPAIDSILPALKQLGADLSDLASAAMPVLAAAATVLAAVIARAIPGIVTALTGLISVVRGVVNIIAGILTGDFGRVWEGVKQLVGGALRVIGGLLRAASAPIRQAWAMIWQGFKGVVSSAWNAIKSVVSGAVRAVVGVIRGYVGAYRAVGSAIFRAVATGIRAVVGAVLAAGRFVVTRVINAARAFVGAALNVGKALFLALGRGVRAVIGAVIGGARAVISGALAAVRGMLGLWLSLGSALIQRLIRGVQVIAGALRGAAKTVVSGALDAIRGILGQAFEIGKAIIQGLINGIKSMAGAAADAAKNVVKGALDGAKSFLHIGSPSKKFFELGAWSGQGFANGLTSTAGMVAAAMRKTVLFPTEAAIDKWTARLEALQAKFDRQDQKSRRAELKRATHSKDKSTRADARRELAELNRETERANKLKVIEINIKGLEKAKRFAEVIRALGDQMQSLAEDAAGNVRKTWETTIDQTLNKALFAIQQSPLGQQLSSLRGQRQAQEMGDLEKGVTDAQAKLDRAARSGSQRLMDEANRDLLDAKLALAEAQVQIQTDAVEREAEIQRGALDVAEEMYKAKLDTDLGNLVTNLNTRAIAYADFVRQVQAILGPLGVDFEPSADDEAGTKSPKRKGPNSNTPRRRRRPNRGRASGGFVASMRGELTRLNELGREGVFLPGGSRVVPASLSNNPGEPGFGGNGFRDLHVHGIPGLTVKDAEAIGERVAHAVQGRRPR